MDDARCMYCVLACPIRLQPRPWFDLLTVRGISSMTRLLPFWLPRSVSSTNSMSTTANSRLIAVFYRTHRGLLAAYPRRFRPRYRQENGDWLP